VLSAAPSRTWADVLVSSFATEADVPPGTSRLVPRQLRAASPAGGLEAGPGFAPAEAGLPREQSRRRATGRSRSTKDRARAQLLREALKNPLALAALILMIGDVPSMPPLETPGTSSFAPAFVGGVPDHGWTEAPPVIISELPPPSQTPEPTALLSGLLGSGITGTYLWTRRRKTATRALAS
jgi:hypothetical protein